MKLLDELSRLVSYDAETGDFIWLPRPESSFHSKSLFCAWNKRNEFTLAGTVGSYGYVIISFGGRKIKAHRLAYFMVHGTCPSEIDHINRIRSDNRIANLRQASSSQNNMNRAICKRNKSGAKGVSWHKKAGKWQVHVRAYGVLVYCGLFLDIDSAVEAR